jgi:hypothetical protein
MRGVFVLELLRDEESDMIDFDFADRIRLAPFWI